LDSTCPHPLLGSCSTLLGSGVDQSSSVAQPTSTTPQHPKIHYKSHMKRLTNRTTTSPYSTKHIPTKLNFQIRTNHHNQIHQIILATRAVKYTTIGCQTHYFLQPKPDDHDVTTHHKLLPLVSIYHSTLTTKHHWMLHSLHSMAHTHDILSLYRHYLSRHDQV